MKNIESLEEILGIKFRDHMLLLSAITHRSYLNEDGRHPVPHNERLEFLGDAVLELVTKEHLYLHHHGSEGEMTNLVMLVVNREHLGEVAKKLGLEQFILLSRSEAKNTGRARLVILSCCLEAVIGAVYFDRGYSACQKLISRTVLVELPKLIKKQSEYDSKGQLQNLVQEHLGVTPTYRIVNESGPDHIKNFKAGVYAGELELGRSPKLVPSKKRG